MLCSFKDVTKGSEFLGLSFDEALNFFQETCLDADDLLEDIQKALTSIS